MCGRDGKSVARFCQLVVRGKRKGEMCEDECMCEYVHVTVCVVKGSPLAQGPMLCGTLGVDSTLLLA